MFNNILSWVKGNYEKLILYILLVFLIMVGLRLFIGWDREKELQTFENRIKLSQTSPVKLEPIYEKNLEVYLIEKPFSYYQPLIDRAVFFPVEIKKPSMPSAPEMNLVCTEVVSTAGGLSATLRNSQTGKIYKVKVEEQIENLTVVAINRDGVVLSREGKQYTLKPPEVTIPFKLTGIMPTEMGFEAMLQNTRTNKTYFVKKNDEVENWKVLSISEDVVIIFRPDAGNYELRMGGELRRIND